MLKYKLENNPTQKIVALSWSGGKDAAMALWKLRQDTTIELKGLLCSVNKHYKRVSMHGIREEVLDVQAEALQLPVFKMYLSQYPDNKEYEEQLLLKYQELKALGVTHIAFGDIFLEELREYRTSLLTKAGLFGLYPLWKTDTRELSFYFVREGFQAITCCINNSFLDETWVGKSLSKEFFDTLPPGVDPCGENGEYHTLVTAGPVFKSNFRVTMGEKVYKALELKTNDDIQTQGFWYIDILNISGCA